MNKFYSAVRKYALPTIGTLGCIGSFSVYYLPNTVLSETLKDVLSFYQSGFHAKVPKYLTKLTKKVISDMQITDKEGAVKLFLVVGTDCIHIGSICNVPFAVGYVGVPALLGAETVREIMEIPLTIDKEPIPWETEMGNQLLRTFILTEQAKKFAIARELFHINTKEYLVKSTLSCSYASLYLAYAYYRRQYTRPLHPLSIGIAYAVVAGVLLPMWLLTKDYVTAYYEKYADANAAGLGLDYANGAVEFYESSLLRNQTYRELLRKGKSYYTIYGNKEIFIREKHTPLTKRLNQVKSIAEALEKNEKQQT